MFHGAGAGWLTHGREVKTREAKGSMICAFENGRRAPVFKQMKKTRPCSVLDAEGKSGYALAPAMLSLFLSCRHCHVFLGGDFGMKGPMVNIA